MSLQLEMTLTAAHRNRYLFSDHYLAHILPDDPRWDAALPEAESFLAWAQDLYARERDQFDEYSETQLEQYWFRPILERLGHVFEIRPAVPGLDAYAKHPDYVFFRDQAARQEAASLQNQDDYTARALAVGEVKRWDTPLGKKRRGGSPSFEDRNPSWQIDYYLRTTDLAWGILTNGRLWRLTHRDTSHRLQIYYEVDLVQLLKEADPGRLRYFTLFFRQAAFRPDPRGRVFLDDALAASNQYAVELEEDLEDNVYRALERLMQGFLDLPANALGPEHLRDVYDNSLYLLYRLLFILYGESRGLLPLDNDQYRTNYSLSRIKQQIADLEFTPAPRTTLYWGQLKNLFHIINGDDAELNRSLGVPRYNGGLFDPQQHPFLEQKQVGDRALVEAIDLVSRRETDGGREFADYRTLGVRHLGSIYEGLLEYQPRVADEPVVAVRDGGDERWVPAAEAPEDARIIDQRAAGDVYLATDRGERKATGSYYTPQYIVEYIVDHAVGPLVEAAVERVRERAKAAPTKAARAAAEQSLVDEILSLKVLDPAMGSGHFLVEATDYLALALATDPYVETAETPEEDLTYWKRRVVERSIYGVDKNPLAVELAKLSLWLATVAADRPLSFLDHHLKCGDSLIGARVEDLGWAPPPVLSKKARTQVEQQKAGQINMFEHVLSQMLPSVMGQILEITREESRDYDTVRAKEAADQAVRELKTPFEAVADLWTSAYFGNAFERGDYDEALGVISRPDTLLGLEPVERAREIAGERRFFHWELAFPEVFYDENGQRLGERAGFDAVVGNPPYDELSQEELGREIDERPYLEAASRFSPAMGYRINVYRLFILQALDLTRDDGWQSFIVPMSLLADRFTLDLRRTLLESVSLRRVEQFPQKDDRLDRVFLSAKLSTCVYVIQKSLPTANRVFVRTHPGRQIRQDSPSYRTRQSKLFEFDPENISVPGVGRAAWNIVTKMAASERFEPLGDVARAVPGELMINRQFKPYLADGPNGEEIIRGAHIGMYEITEPKQGETLYLRRAKYLSEHQGSEKAFHHQHRRVVYQRYAAIDNYRRLIATMLPEGYFCSHTVGYLAGVRDRALGFLLSLLNSEILDWRFNLTSTNNNINGYEVEALAIPRIRFTTPANDRQRLVADGIAQAAEYIASTAQTSVKSIRFSPFSDSTLARWLDQRLSADPEQADVVHDLLAHLAERMIAMHQQKHDRTEAFWLDLEGVTDPDTFEDLKEHGKWEASLWKAEPCRPFVDQDSRSTRHLDDSLAWNEACFKPFVKMLAGRVSNLSDLVAVYRAHHPPYHALVRRIEATDRLIDRIVYRLYALTADEVAVVEGNR